MPLGVSLPAECMGSQRHHSPVPNNITKKTVKGQVMKPCPPRFQHHYLTYKYLLFQFHCCRTVHTIGDISGPRMNGKPATPSPCHQQHYKEGGKRARYETIPSTFSVPLPHKRIFIFSRDISTPRMNGKPATPSPCRQ